MTRDDLLEARDRVIRTHGAWTSHNIALPHGVFTMGDQPVGDNFRVHKFLQVVQDILRRPFSELRVLDLACLEGLYAIEFAQQGASGLGVEGREANLAKAEFARAALGLDRLRFVQGDVRDVSVERDGTFDVIICSGILYHLDEPDVFTFLAALRRMCTGVMVIDTRVALQATRTASFQGRDYDGCGYKEHEAGLDPDQKLKDLWASLDNEESFWFTRASLANALADLGFTSVYEVLAPVPFRIREDRITLVALPGVAALPANAIGQDTSALRWPPQGRATP